MRSLRVFAVAIGLAACGGPPVTPALPAAPNDALPQGHLLLVPVSNPERLLGHAVVKKPDGGFTIADDLAPGCDVRPLHEPGKLHIARDMALEECTSAAGAVLSIASAKAKWGESVVVHVEVDNDEVVRAELSGPCGDEVVSEVLVGTGARSIERRSNLQGELGARAPGGSASATTDRSARELDRMEWKVPEAYAFKTRAMPGANLLEVDVQLASEVLEGDSVAFDIVTSADASLLVYYVGGDGKGDPLLPSAEEPRPRTQASQPFAIPTPAQRAAHIKFVAQLLKKGEASRERLIVYAFREPGDYALVKTAIDDAAGDPDKLEKAVEKRLEKVPLARYAKRTVAYTIRPKGK